MDSFRRAMSGLFTRRPEATLAIESEAPASVLPSKPTLGRHSRPFGADHYYTIMGQSLMSRVVSNPDHLTVNDYRAMLDRDDAVKWCVKYSSLCIQSNWREYLNPDSKRVYNFVQELFDRCETGLMDWVEEAAGSSKWAGYSVTESCLTYDEGKIWAKELPVIDPDLEFVIDQREGSQTFGKVVAIRQGLFGGLPTQREIPVERLILHANNSRFGNPYGVSDLKCSFTKFVAKEHLFLQWGRTIERYGTPSAYGTSGSLDNEESSWLNPGTTMTRGDNILDMLARLGEDAVAALPEDVKIQFLEAKNAVGQDFESHQNYCTKAVMRGFLASSILSETSDVGSFALGEKHFDVFMANCALDAQKLQRNFMRYLLGPIIRWNFGPKAPLGGFAKPSLSIEVREALSRIFFSLTNAGYMSPGSREDSDMVREINGAKPYSDADLKAAGERHNAAKGKSSGMGAGENLPPGQAPDGQRGTDPGIPNVTPQTPGRPQGRQDRKVA